MKQIIEKTIKGFGELPHMGKPPFSWTPVWGVFILALVVWAGSDPSNFRAVVVLWTLYAALTVVYGLACCYGAYDRTVTDERIDRMTKRSNPVDEDLDPPVHLDVERLTKSIESGTIRVPMGLSRQERREYLHNLAEALKNVDKD